MRRLNALVTGCLIALVASGCKSKEDPIVGDWKDPKATVITFKPDHTFTQSDGLSAGKWSFADGTLTLKIEKLMGVSPEAYLQPKDTGSRQALTPVELKALEQMTSDIELALSSDGKHLTPVDTIIGPERVLTKQEAK